MLDVYCATLNFQRNVVWCREKITGGAQGKIYTTDKQRVDVANAKVNIFVSVPYDDSLLQIVEGDCLPSPDWI